MRNNMLRIGSGAALFAAFLVFVGRPPELAAILLPAAVHELGHILMLQLMGLRIKGFHIQLRGFCIEYCGYTGAVGHALAAAAGPAAGFAYALAASRLGNQTDSAWICMSAGVSLLLSLFNLLPALPLDGGRVLLQLGCAFFGPRQGTRLTELCGLLTGGTLLALGIWLMLTGRGLGLLLAAIWLLLFQEDGQGIVKRREIV